MRWSASATRNFAEQKLNKKAGPENLPPGVRGQEPKWVRRVLAFYAIPQKNILPTQSCPDFETSANAHKIALNICHSDKERSDEEESAIFVHQKKSRFLL